MFPCDIALSEHVGGWETMGVAAALCIPNATQVSAQLPKCLDEAITWNLYKII